MNDTAPDMEHLYNTLIMSRTPEERLLMATRMFHTAKILVEAGIRAQCGELPPAEMRRRVFLRFYGNELPQEELEEILKQI